MTTTLLFSGRPWTTNVAYNWHKMKRSDEVRMVRLYAKLFAISEKVPSHERVIITFAQECRTKVMPDTGACYLWCKAVEDGLVDAGVIPKDTPEHVAELRFPAPVTTGRDCVVVTIEDV
jgi:hypothetical protein